MSICQCNVSASLLEGTLREGGGRQIAAPHPPSLSLRAHRRPLSALPPPRFEPIQPLSELGEGRAAAGEWLPAPDRRSIGAVGAACGPQRRTACPRKEVTP